MKKRQGRVLIGCMLFFLLLLPVTEVRAEDWEDSNPDDYVTKHFDVDMRFDKSHTASVTEVIQVDFRQSHHGIVRNIPKAKDNTYEIKDISVEGYKYAVSSETNNEVIKIGDANLFLTGDATFTIHYKIVYYKDSDRKADFLVQNVLPTEWQTSIRQSTLHLEMPTKIDWENMNIYAGVYGSSDAAAWKEKFATTVEGNTITLEGKKLPKGYGVTLRDVELPDGYWSEAIDFLKTHLGIIVAILAAAAATSILAILMWIRNGRDNKIVETIEFYPPDNMTPAEVGYALDEELADFEMMTTVFYLANKGYISIEKKREDFILKKEKEVDSEEPKFVETFTKGLFKTKSIVNTAKVPTSFRSSFDKAKEEVKAAYEEKHGEVFEATSCVSRYACILLAALNVAVLGLVMEGMDGMYLAVIPGILIAIGLVIAWSGFDNLSVKRVKNIIKIIVGGILYLIGPGFIALCYDIYPTRAHLYAYMAAEILIFMFSLIMQKRSQGNVEIMGKLYGFRRFIKEAEYDRIVQLCDEDPEYFYHILPYAAVLGLETTWTKHFEKIEIPQPEWFRSDEARFLYSAVWCNQMMQSCTRAAIPYPPSAGHSGSSRGFSGGSSGGGFSGGGGGGGGGGAW